MAIALLGDPPRRLRLGRDQKVVPRGFCNDSVTKSWIEISRRNSDRNEEGDIEQSAHFRRRMRPREREGRRRIQRTMSNDRNMEKDCDSDHERAWIRSLLIRRTECPILGGFVPSTQAVAREFVGPFDRFFEHETFMIRTKYQVSAIPVK